MGIMAISGVAWDAGLYLVDLLVQLSIRRRIYLVHNQPTDDSLIEDNNYIGNKKSLMIDDNDAPMIFINYNERNMSDMINDFSFGCTLDIGCGTGIGGITALLLGAEYVLFTDTHKLSCLDDTLNQLKLRHVLVDKTTDFVSYEWNEEVIDERIKCCKNYTGGDCLGSNDSSNGNHNKSSSSSGSNRGVHHENHHQQGAIKHWDTVICSDLLYDAANHTKLLSVLKGIKFNKALISYKKRHNIPESDFFRRLSQNFDIFLIDPISITLNNLPSTALSGLYLLLIIPIRDLGRDL